MAGGSSQPFLSSCCGENFPTMCSHARDTQRMQDQVELDRTAATVAFYQQVTTYAIVLRSRTLIAHLGEFHTAGRNI